MPYVIDKDTGIMLMDRSIEFLISALLMREASLSAPDDDDTHMLVFTAADAVATSGPATELAVALYKRVQGNKPFDSPMSYADMGLFMEGIAREALSLLGGLTDGPVQ